MAQLLKSSEQAADDVHEAELVRALGAGEAGAYRELSNRYVSRVLHYSQRLLRDTAEAEDVTQEVFLRLWQNAEKLERSQSGRIGMWLFRVAHNLCIDRLRITRRYTDDAEEPVTESQRPSAMLERRQTAASVHKLLEELPERQRAAILLSHFEGLGNEEIGGVMGVGVEAVESLLSRGRKRLREALSGTEP